MNSFYGNLKNNSRASFIFDKVYSTRKAMDDAVKNGTDGVFVNRYVLIAYNYSQDANYNVSNHSQYGYDTYIDQNDNYGKFEDKVFVDHRNLDIAEYGAQYDKTVWMKIYSNNEEKYIQVGALNAAAPAFELSIDAPGEEDGRPHFDFYHSGDLNYSYHMPKNWDLVLNHYSDLDDNLFIPVNFDDTLTYEKNKFFYKDGSFYKKDDQENSTPDRQYFLPKDGTRYSYYYEDFYNSSSQETRARQYPYVNNSGFNANVRYYDYVNQDDIKFTEVPSGEEYPEHVYVVIKLTADTYIKNTFYIKEDEKFRLTGHNDEFDPDETYYIKTQGSFELVERFADEVSADEGPINYQVTPNYAANKFFYIKDGQYVLDSSPTKEPERIYYRYRIDHPTSIQNDTKRLDIELPSIGNAISDVYDSIYGRPLKPNYPNGIKYINQLKYTNATQKANFKISVPQGVNLKDYIKVLIDGTQYYLTLKQYKDLYNTYDEKEHPIIVSPYPYQDYADKDHTLQCSIDGKYYYLTPEEWENNQGNTPEPLYDTYDELTHPIPVYNLANAPRPYTQQQLYNFLNIEPYNNVTPNDPVSMAWGVEELKKYISELRYLSHGEVDGSYDPMVYNGNGLQSDWAIDDPTSFGYIYNRPTVITHYVQKTSDEVLNEEEYFYMRNISNEKHVPYFFEGQISNADQNPKFDYSAYEYTQVNYQNFEYKENVFYYKDELTNEYHLDDSPTQVEGRAYYTRSASKVLSQIPITYKKSDGPDTYSNIETPPIFEVADITTHFKFNDENTCEIYSYNIINNSFAPDKPYQPNTYYIKNESDHYVLDASTEPQENIRYYEQKNIDGNISYDFVNGNFPSNQPYEKNRYYYYNAGEYILENKEAQQKNINYFERKDEDILSESFLFKELNMGSSTKELTIQIPDTQSTTTINQYTYYFNTVLNELFEPTYEAVLISDTEYKQDTYYYKPSATSSVYDLDHKETKTQDRQYYRKVNKGKLNKQHVNDLYLGLGGKIIYQLVFKPGKSLDTCLAAVNKTMDNITIDDMLEILNNPGFYDENIEKIVFATSRIAGTTIPLNFMDTTLTRDGKFHIYTNIKYWKTGLPIEKIWQNIPVEDIIVTEMYYDIDDVNDRIGNDAPIEESVNVLQSPFMSLNNSVNTLTTRASTLEQIVGNAADLSKEEQQDTLLSRTTNLEGIVGADPDTADGTTLVKRVANTETAISNVQDYIGNSDIETSAPATLGGRIKTLETYVGSAAIEKSVTATSDISNIGIRVKSLENYVGNIGRTVTSTGAISERVEVLENNVQSLQNYVGDNNTTATLGYRMATLESVVGNDSTPSTLVYRMKVEEDKSASANNAITNLKTRVDTLDHITIGSTTAANEYYNNYDYSLNDRIDVLDDINNVYNDAPIVTISTTAIQAAHNTTLEVEIEEE